MIKREPHGLSFDDLIFMLGGEGNYYVGDTEDWDEWCKSCNTPLYECKALNEVN